MLIFIFLDLNIFKYFGFLLLFGKMYIIMGVGFG